MGQRANYIIKKEGETKIYYSHWRANLIAKDLFLGKDDFIKFIQRFDEKTELINYPWIEGFVIIDFDHKEILFQEQELLYQSSILEAYKKEVQSKWQGWKFEFAKEGLYTLQHKVNSEYINSQEDEFEQIEIASLKEENEYLNLASILKCDNGEIRIHYFNSEFDSFLTIGTELIPFLKSWKVQPILNEEVFDYKSVVFIDESNKHLILGEGIPKLKEKLEKIWMGWKVEIQELGYLNLLEKSGIEVKDFRLSEDKIQNRIQEIKNIKDNFDPKDFAERFTQEAKDVKFHPNFFEDIKPKKSNWLNQILKKIKTAWNKV